jgi:hypothetical protein
MRGTTIPDVHQQAKELLPHDLRAAAKSAVRGFGIVTAPLRPGPDFMIIGTKRGGTTSLFNYLLRHPDVAPLFLSLENRKGVHYFDTNFHKGWAWYRSHFPTSISRALRGRPRRSVLVGEASPYYLFHPHAAARARREVPNAKLIVLLRNPIDRAFSHYKERRRNGVEPLTFEEAIDREPERLSGELDRIRRDPGYVSLAHEHYSYVSQGIYLPQIQAWMDHYPRDRFCIVRSEDLFSDPQGAYAAVLRFLGLAATDLKHYERFNFHTSEDMYAGTRERLAATFAPHNRGLADFLGLDLAWD